MLGLHVLFANDDVLSQWIMSDVLSECGYTVTSACRGTQVVELLANPLDYDVLLVDATLLDRARNTSLIKVWNKALFSRPIIYTGRYRDVWQHRLQSNEYFLQTPYLAKTLLETIDQAVEAANHSPFVMAAPRSVHHIH